MMPAQTVLRRTAFAEILATSLHMLATLLQNHPVTS
jgi:hypothetical protein